MIPGWSGKSHFCARVCNPEIKMETTEELKERVILAAVCTGQDESTEDSLAELGELADTAGAQVLASMIQNRESVHPGTYFGKGKIRELKEAVLALDATGIICDDELSPAQLNNLQQELGCKVVDRSLLILDIFARHASTAEGKLQVELAQLRYRSARLVGMRASLSRLGGGIGTRGPGEKKLETDRRLIRARISTLRSELEELERHRSLLRDGRAKRTMKTAAIVGYTNAGKSTLLNALTGAGVLSEDKLFATLDPTSRALELEDGQQVLLTDTVGFIRKLPHHLVEAFRSTLEEAKYADYIIHVTDAANPQAPMQMQVVYETLQELGVTGKPVITLFNKCDLLTDEERLELRDTRADHVLRISAAGGEGLDKLKDLISSLISEDMILIERVYPYDQARMAGWIRAHGQLLSEEYTPGGIAIRARIPKEYYAKL